MEPRRNDVRSFVLAAAACVGAAVALVNAPDFRAAIQDDGFIYFRIAENAAAGRGPVFNPGDRVDAATSPVWVWVLALAARFGAPTPVAAQILGLVSLLAAGIWAARWAIELGGARRPLANAVAAAFPLATVLDPRSLSYAFSGMETALAALVWLVAIRACVLRFFGLGPAPHAGLWVLAAGLVRPEFALVVTGLGLAAWRCGARPAPALARDLAPALAGTALYLAAHTLYFGTPWPNTWIAKRQSDVVHLQIGLAYLAGLPREYPWFFLGFASLLVPLLRKVGIGVTAGVVLYALHVATLGGDHFVFYRPFVILLPSLLALAGAAAAGVIESGARPARVAAAAAIVAAIATLGGAATRSVAPGAFGWVRQAAQLGHALARTYPPTTSVGVFAIGAVGYTSKLPIVDALGLADRHVARQDLSREHSCALDIGHERGDPAYVLSRSQVIVPFAAFATAPWESLEEIRDGFHSHKRFLEAARPEVAAGRWRIRNVEIGPGAHAALLERRRVGGTP